MSYIKRAYPIAIPENGDCNLGMLLLDYFAGQYVAGRLHPNAPKEVAKLAYDYAEALIEERMNRNHE